MGWHPRWEGGVVIEFTERSHARLLHIEDIETFAALHGGEAVLEDGL